MRSKVTPVVRGPETELERLVRGSDRELVSGVE